MADRMKPDERRAQEDALWSAPDRAESALTPPQAVPPSPRSAKDPEDGLFAALARAQLEMTGAKKDSANPHFKSKYADLDSVREACLPALNKHGISVYQQVGEDERGLFVRTVLAHKFGETIEDRVPLILPERGDMQKLGSAITYARRYGLMAMAGIAPEDDDGNATRPDEGQRTTRRAGPAPAAPPKPGGNGGNGPAALTPEQRKQLAERARQKAAAGRGAFEDWKAKLQPHHIAYLRTLEDELTRIRDEAEERRALEGAADYDPAEEERARAEWEQQQAERGEPA